MPLYPLMLAGRFLQGLGAAGPRTVSIALVRDRFQGSDMARIMSFIMTVFILVPILAPAVGLDSVVRAHGSIPIFCATWARPPARIQVSMSLT